MPESVGTPLLWVGFTVFILFLLTLDLGVFHRKAHAVGYREALLWSLVWIGLALSFNVVVYLWFGRQRALEYLTGYVIEKALSVDNIFVFIVIFRYFAVTAAYQHRVLFWGILGALVMRMAFILTGAVVLERFQWTAYLFGAFLIYAGIRLIYVGDVEVHPERNPLVRLFQKLVPCTSQYSGARLWVRQSGRIMATPLLLVLVVVEATDVVFAVDSIPAIFAITRDPFIVYTSNIFAILGLRALYFLLAGAMAQFRYLKVGLGCVLTYVGIKMTIHDYFHIPTGVSLAVVAILLGGAVVASLVRKDLTGIAPPEAPKDAAPAVSSAQHEE
ncbi:MAG: TerC family protein [Acidobacteria bacterium]|nr:TerC family protein [Acidobacteriota bacterium]